MCCRAEEWNLANPMFTGCLRVYQADRHVRIVLYRFVNPSSRSTSDENLIAFAECPFGNNATASHFLDYS
jgi:hypothetical protein